MIEVRRSILEEFAKLTTTEYGDEAELIARIKGDALEPNWMMQAGTDWHSALEGTDCEVVEGEPRRFLGGCWFDEDVIDQAIAYVGPGVRELTGYAVFPTLRGSCRVEATADHLNGLVIQDHKTKFTPVDAESVENALQWRFYLHIHQCDVFRYNFWHFRDPDETGYCEFKGLESMKFWRYPHLWHDCQLWVEEYVHWADARDLLPYLTSSKLPVSR